MSIEEVKAAFRQRFGKAPRVFRSPGRINLIGDHTDYNLGFVFPAAIDRYVTLALAPNERDEFTVHALDLDERITAPLSIVESEASSHWSGYFKGVTSLMLQKNVALQGFDCVFSSNIPVGAGLSSSAAICAGFAFALNTLFEGGLTRADLVRLAQQTEHEFIGLQCGIMDQTASLFGKNGKAILLDCLSENHQYVPLELQNYQLVICDSKIKHELVSTGYNDRRKDCDEALDMLQKAGHEIENLRQVSSDLLNAQKEYLGKQRYKRVSFVLEENQRVLDAASCLEHGNVPLLGELMYASHEGLSVMYEVSCPEMDFLVAQTKGLAYVAGARMMGGGFGGCTLNLVARDFVPEFKALMTQAYKEAYDLAPELITVNTGEGSHEM